MSSSSNLHVLQQTESQDLLERLREIKNQLKPILHKIGELRLQEPQAARQFDKPLRDMLFAVQLHTPNSIQLGADSPLHTQGGLTPAPITNPDALVEEELSASFDRLFGDTPSPQASHPNETMSYHPTYTPPPASQPAQGTVGFLGEALPPGVAAPQFAPPPQFAPSNAQAQTMAQYHQDPFSFVDTSLVNQLSSEKLDDLPYGLIQLDARGKVVNYNDTESRMVGLPKTFVIGKNFFQDVAPCTRVREFEGRFRDLAEGRSKSTIESFEFVFNFRRGAQRVLITIFRGRKRGIFNVAIIRR